MARYTYSETLIQNETKKRYLESVIYPKIKPDDDDFYIIAEASDRLDILSKKYYNDAKYWWVIAVANNINDATLFVEPGAQIRIPANISKVLNDLKKTNE